MHQHRSVHLKISRVKRRKYIYIKKETLRKRSRKVTIAILDEILKPLESHELTMVILHELHTHTHTHIYIYVPTWRGKNHSHQSKKVLHFNK